ncbi:MAG: undecaprenyldiphospho-muramoylpentapeptide beta-N-acetylglucosaminyltransferase [Flavobacteriaceae bacterium]
MYSVKPFRLIISGGGTGGHIYPALAIATAVKENFTDAEILFVGAKGKMEMEKVPKAGFPIKGFWIAGFQRSFSISNLLFPLKLIVSLLQAYIEFKKFKPTVVVGTGGFASGPILQVAQWLGVPTLVQEQNSFPGITNRILSKKVDRVCVAYTGMERFFPKSKIRLTGNPVRSSLTKIKSNGTAKTFFGLDPDKKTLAVIGGSLGAKKINELIQTKLAFIKEMGLQILWQCGSLYYDSYANNSEEGVVIRPFIYEMDQFYAASDFIISRAGAGSISELCCVGKPLLLIPSPNVTANHQLRNAEALAEYNAALLLEEHQLEEQFEHQFSSLVKDEKQQQMLKTNIKKLAKPDATEAILNQIKELL